MYFFTAVIAANMKPGVVHCNCPSIVCLDTVSLTYILTFPDAGAIWPSAAFLSFIIFHLYLLLYKKIFFKGVQENTVQSILKSTFGLKIPS